MNDNIKWNYNMKEAPRNGTWILVSDGEDIWSSAQCEKNRWYSGWYCVEFSEKIIAWAPFNLPDKERTFDDQMEAYVTTLRNAWNHWANDHYLDNGCVDRMPQYHAEEICSAIENLVIHCLPKTK